MMKILLIFSVLLCVNTEPIKCDFMFLQQVEGIVWNNVFTEMCHRFLDKTGLLSIVHLSIAEYTVPSRVDTFNHTVNLFAAKSLHYLLTFEPSKKTVIFVHGFNDDPYQTPGRTTAEALKKAGGYNILAWDSSSAMSLDYVSSAVNVRKIGTHLAIFLNQLTRMVKVKPENIHLVGHNLGTQISGYADFYPNGESLSQLGCDHPTSHSLAWMYFAESITNPNNFIGLRCDSWNSFVDSKCTQNSRAVMGLHTPNTTSGNYYLVTRNVSEYGLGIRRIQTTILKRTLL